jgi:NAD(P)H dehydrogenase (quinone)
MILITGAAGKTGRAVLSALVNRKTVVRVFVHRHEQAAELMAAGAANTLVGDFNTTEIYKKALDGVSSLYHICPNMHPAEIEIGKSIIDAAVKSGLKHFVYHSVLHPQAEKMPHHWNKMRVEELLFESGLNFTILQPAPYMQNILTGKEAILKESFFRVPYPAGTALSLIDLRDLGEAAAKILTEGHHRDAVYELCGTEPLTQLEVAAILSKATGKTVKFEELNIADWQKTANNLGLGHYELETLTKMFQYYAAFGLRGNRNHLRWLLGREPGNLIDFAKREII